jgi:cytochrome P450
MEQERDINGVIASAWTFLGYGIIVGQFPGLHKWLLGNPSFYEFLDRFSNSNPLRMITAVAKNAIAKYDAEKPTGTRGDLLEFLRQKQRQNPEVMTDRDLMNNILLFL